MNEFTKPLSDLSGNAKDYVDLKVDELKLSVVKGLSISVSKALALMLIIGVGSVVLLALCFGLVLLLGEALGSYADGALIVAGALLLVFIILILLRNRLFESRFVRLFAQLFFGSHDHNDHDNEEE